MEDEGINSSLAQLQAASPDHHEFPASWKIGNGSSVCYNYNTDRIMATIEGVHEANHLLPLPGLMPKIRKVNGIELLKENIQTMAISSTQRMNLLFYQRIQI